MRGWKTEACSSCRGHGVVSVYSYNDFEGPGECSDCDGRGWNATHIKSGVIAAWPGGPFIGHLTKQEMEGEL